MVRTLIIGIVVSVWLSQAHAANNHEFTVSVETKQIELGKPLTLRLHSNQTRTPLTQIDLSEIKNQFHINSHSDTLKYVRNAQYWEIQLYPRSQQTTTIPALFFLNKLASPIDIQVLSPVDSKTGTPIQVSYAAIPDEVWERQTIRIVCRISTEFPIANIVSRVATHNAFTIQQTESQSNRTEQGYIHQAGWLVQSHQKGRQQLELPGVQLVRDGVVTHVFFPPIIRVSVQALPFYLPPGIPVGNFQASFESSMWPLVIKDRIHKLRIKLSSDNNRLENLTNLGIRIRSNDTVQLFDQSHTLTWQYKNEKWHAHNDILFTARQTGLSALPTIELRYFDPVSGQLKNQHLTGPVFLVLPIWLTILTGLILLWLIYIFGRPVANHMYRSLLSLTAHYVVLRQLPDYATAEKISDSIRQLALLDGIGTNISIQTWSRRCHRNLRPLTEELARQLNQAMFSQQETHIETILKLLHQYIKQRWGLLKLVR